MCKLNRIAVEDAHVCGVCVAGVNMDYNVSMAAFRFRSSTSRWAITVAYSSARSTREDLAMPAERSLLLHALLDAYEMQRVDRFAICRLP